MYIQNDLLSSRVLDAALDPNAPEDAQTFEWFAECSAGAPMGLEAENLCGEMMTEAYIRQLPGGVDALGGAGLEEAAPGGISKCADSEALAARSVAARIVSA